MKILKIFAKRLPIIAVIIGLLVLQATCDLKLPEYTADIVNVGISNNGIESIVPVIISEDDYEKINILLTKDEQEILSNNYHKLNGSNYDANDLNDIKEKYGVEDNVYIKHTDTNLEEMFETINVLYIGFTTEMTTINNIETFAYIESLPESNKTEVLNIYETEMNKQIPADIKVTALIKTVETYYNNASVDIESIQFDYILSKGIMMVLLACSAMVLTISVVYLASRVAASICKEFRTKIVNKSMKFSNNEFETLTTSSLITRSTNDIQQVQNFIVIAIRLVFYAPILGIGAYAKVSGNQMNWIILLSILAVLALITVLFTVAMPKFKSIQLKIDKLNLITKEILSGLPVIRAFGTERHEEKRFDKSNEDLTKTTRFVDRIMSAMFPAMMFIMNGTGILIVWAGAQYVDTGSMQIGDILATLTYSMQIIMAFLMFSMISIMMPRSLVALKRINEVLATKTTIENIDEPIIPKKIEGVLEFQNVSFKYMGAEETVINDISFTATPGTTTAIIGSTGSGKSTLLNLIPRLYDPTLGKITLDGNNIKDVDLETLRDNIGYIPQKNLLFSGTINSNIALGLKRSDKKKISNAANIAQAVNFIEEKDKQYDSLVSQGGTNYSGGQKQRLSIARAIAKNPKIYLFDDSFSALDFKTDTTLRKELNKAATDATIIIVAQRVSTIMGANQILVLDEGKLVGVGTHQELLKNCEVYKEIATSQLSKEELQNA